MGGIEQGDDGVTPVLPTVAFIGLGRMGGPMAANVGTAGFPLRLYNRTSQKAEDLAVRLGATFCQTPGEAAEGADIVITMLADADAVAKVYRNGGVLESIRSGALLVDMGTTGPEAVKDLARSVELAGGRPVDAPVSGSVAAAEAGTLTILAGGSSADVDAARGVLGAIGGKIYHLGPVGSGALMKLAVNQIIFGLTQAVSEALVLAERGGIARGQAYEVFENSAVAAPMVTYRRGAFLDPDATPTAFAIALGEKDLRLIVAQAEAVGCPVPQAETNLAVMSKARLAGFGDQDIAAVAVYLRKEGSLG
jgi:3-hydroxyisobutyrate dehydrogenase-like beta-hydroxyacid dehydrogenase